MKKIFLFFSLMTTFLLAACQEQDVPTLQVKKNVIFDQVKTVNYPHSDEYTTDNAQIEVRGELSETGIKWLDQLLLKHAYTLVGGEDSMKKDTPTKQDLVQKFQQIHDEFVQSAKEDRVLGASFHLTSNYLGQRNNIITFTNDIDTYTGGAHGINVTLYQNIDSHKKKILEVNDIIQQDQQTKLKEVLWSFYTNLMQEANDDYIGMITKEDFNISEQFYFNNEGINFVYPPYALRAYAYGNVVLTAYWHEIEDIINPEYNWKK